MFNLNGRKEWITNSRHADLYAVSVRFEKVQEVNTKTGIALLEKGQEGLSVLEDHQRSGVFGVSLAPVELKNVKASAEQFIGNFDTEGTTMIASSQVHLLLGGAARAVGASRAVVDSLL